MRRLFLVIVATAMFVTASAQTEGGEAKMSNKERQEQIMQVRLDLLRTELELDDEVFEEFATVYRKFRSDIQRVTTNAANVKRANLTNENALKVVAARLHNQINTASVKQRYLFIFADVLEPLQIEKLYRIEGRISSEARKIIKARQASK
jgi:hypothetical protein